MGGCLSRKYPFEPSKDLLDLAGKVVLVTGGNTGIGYETVKQLARRGAKVYLGARDESKATGAIAKLQAEGLGQGQVVWLKVDFSDPRLAKRAAEEFIDCESRLDILSTCLLPWDSPHSHEALFLTVNNAAQLTGAFEKSNDGISKLMVVNHFGPYVFTRTLLPLMSKTSEEPNSDVRIVTLTSFAHDRARAAAPDISFRDIEDFNTEFADDFYPDWSRYSVTKLTNILFMNELQRRLDASKTAITCISIHPGEVNTFASRTPFPVLASIFMGLFFVTPEVGAYNSCFAAASPLIRQHPEKYKAIYLVPVGVIQAPGKNAQRDDLARDLWETTENVLKDLAI